MKMVKKFIRRKCIHCNKSSVINISKYIKKAKEEQQESFEECNHRGTIYCSERYDSRYCSKCDTWLEGKCDDEYCCFCSNRPEKPSQVLHHTFKDEDDVKEHQQAIKLMVEMTKEKFGKICEKCGSEVVNARGIGEYCTNDGCENDVKCL